jgi:fatty acid desaturase
MCRKPSPAGKDRLSSCELIAANTKLPENVQWLKSFDYDGFASEIRILGKQLEAQQGAADVTHLQRMVGWSNMFAAIGLFSMGFGVNPISIICLSLYTFSRWTMIAHHTCHGGYDRVCKEQDNGRFTRFKFAIGTFWRRFNDWFDWMMPEAWNVEHNNRHHYNLSEGSDPDLVERNLSDLRQMNVPLWAKYIYCAVIMCVWKWFYYAPNTYKELKLARWRREGKALPQGVDPEDSITLKSMMLGSNPFYSATEFIGIVLGPYFLIHFLITPLPYLLLGEYLDGYTGRQMYWNAVTNLFIADIITNIHGFTAIVTNHAGDDMYRFRDPCRPYSGSFYLRQVLASVDYSMGSDAVDFMHGWLNYQIEHHMFPSLSMLSYQKSAPQVQAICQKYGVPYIKQHVLIRLKKTIDIMVGTSTMPWFPPEYEALYLEKDALVEAEKME